MLFGSLTKITTPLLGGTTTAAASSQVQAKIPEKTTAESSIPPASQTAPTPLASPPGVVFDLSEAAAQIVAASTPTTGAAAPMADSPTPTEPPAFAPTAMAAAAGIAAIAPAVSSAPPAAPVSVPAATAPLRAAARADVAPPTAHTAPKAEPDEEARARALAIQAQDRSQLLSLARQLSETRADPLAALSVGAADDRSDDRSAGIAA